MVFTLNHNIYVMIFITFNVMIFMMCFSIRLTLMWARDLNINVAKDILNN